MGKTLNAKLMEEKLKRGWTIAQFTEYLELTEEDFLRKLKETFREKACRGMLARLKQNEKHSRLRNSSKQETVPNSAPQNHSSEIIINEDDNFDEVQKQSESSLLFNELEDLRVQKKRAEDVLNELELKHQQLSSERIQLRNSISEYRDTFLALKKQISQIQSELSDLVNTLNQKYSEMQTLNESISKTRDVLDEINTKIDTLQKITIFVYDSGEIEIDSSVIFEIPTSTDLFEKNIERLRSRYVKKYICK